jgi:fatty acid-binding protein DegV
MKYAIVMDSVGCIPEKEYNKRSIKLLPLAVRFDGVHYVDSYIEKALIPIHAAKRVGIESDSVSVTPSSDDVRKYLIKEIAPTFDVAIFQTVGQSYTPIFQSCKAVSDSIAADAKATRLKAGITTPFRMTTSDTGTVVAGQGLIALYSDDLLQTGMSLSEFTPLIEDFKALVKTFIVVKDSVYARHRQKQKGNKTVSYPVAVIAKALHVSPITLAQNQKIDVVDLKTRGFDNSLEKVLEYCIDRVREGLLAPLINISVAGDPTTLTKHNSYKRLQHVCHDASIELYVGVMTLGATINVGPGAVSVGIAPSNQDEEP